jgi:hypothetical protein
MVEYKQRPERRERKYYLEAEAYELIVLGNDLAGACRKFGSGTVHLV